MTIKKILNNNVILAENDAGREIVAMGKGIAFKRRVGEEVADSEIERIYTLSSKNVMERFKELVASFSSDYLKISTEIIDFAQKFLDTKLNESIYVSLTDHIHMAIHRIRNGMMIHNMLIFEIRKFYEQEYHIGLKAVELINKNFGVKLPEDEAGFIALHIIDAQMEFKQPTANKIMQLIHELINVVRMVSGVEVDTNSLAYYRFVTHLKFFAQRVFGMQELSDDDVESDIHLMIKQKYSQAYDCAEKIASLVESKYHYKVNSEEKFYLAIHIAKIIQKS